MSSNCTDLRPYFQKKITGDDSRGPRTPITGTPPPLALGARVNAVPFFSELPRGRWIHYAAARKATTWASCGVSHFQAKSLLAAQAIPLIATCFFVAWSVCLSVCRLSRSCTLCLGFRCQLAVTPVGSDPMTHCVRWGVPEPQLGKGRFGRRTLSQNMQLQTAAKPSVLCCHLANTNEESGGYSDSAFCQITLVFATLSSRLFRAGLPLELRTSLAFFTSTKIGSLLQDKIPVHAGV